MSAVVGVRHLDATWDGICAERLGLGEFGLLKIHHPFNFG